MGENVKESFKGMIGGCSLRRNNTVFYQFLIKIEP